MHTAKYLLLYTNFVKIWIQFDFKLDYKTKNSFGSHARIARHLFWLFYTETHSFIHVYSVLTYKNTAHMI